MDRKNLFLITAVCIAAAVLLAVLLLPGADTPTGEISGTTAPVQAGTVPGQIQQEPEQTQTAPPDETEPQQLPPDDTAPEQTEPDDTEPKQTEGPVYDTVLFPVEIENGLQVRGIFQFSGMNPDVDNLFGEEIAGVQLVNTSEEHLVRAEITAVLADGTTLTFRAEDVPAGKSVMAFCLEHERLPEADMCEEIFGWAEFDSADPRNPEQVRVTVSGTEITIQNVSGRNLTDLHVFCHSLLDDSYFGGATYSYRIATLPAGKSTVVIAEDCFLGMTEVVRVDLGG